MNELILPAAVALPAGPPMRRRGGAWIPRREGEGGVPVCARSPRFDGSRTVTFGFDKKWSMHEVSP